MGSLGGSFTTSKKVGFISSKTIFECYSFKAFSQFMIIVPRGTKMFFCRNIFVDFSASKERILLVLCLRICCNTAFFILMPAKRLRLVWQKLLFALFISFFIQISDFLLANCCRREKKFLQKIFIIVKTSYEALLKVERRKSQLSELRQSKFGPKQIIQVGLNTQIVCYPESAFGWNLRKDLVMIR